MSNLGEGLGRRRRRHRRHHLGTNRGMQCIRWHHTSAGRRCAEYGTLGDYGEFGSTRGKHCVRHKRTRAGRRCARYA